MQFLQDNQFRTFVGTKPDAIFQFLYIICPVTGIRLLNQSYLH